jgi:hypothetical protein
MLLGRVTSRTVIRWEINESPLSASAVGWLNTKLSETPGSKNSDSFTVPQGQNPRDQGVGRLTTSNARTWSQTHRYATGRIGPVSSIICCREHFTACQHSLLRLAPHQDNQFGLGPFFLFHVVPSLEWKLRLISLTST